MKIVLLNDTHLGVKNSSDIFLNYQKAFFEEVFFPYCLKHKIKKIIHAGDFYEHRKYVSIKVLNWSRVNFFYKLREYGMTMDIIPGNHDTALKNTNSLCSLVEIHTHFSDVVNVITDPTTINYDGLDISLLPWIANDNYNASMEFIATSRAPILIGHLELCGYQMMKGHPVISHGLDDKMFSRYEMVLSGHYHTKSTKKNIHYLGTQFELTWADCNDSKHFHVLDTDTRELKAVKNPKRIFNKITYKDNPDIKLPDLKGSYVKLIVLSKKDQSKFDTIVDRIQKEEPHDLKIIESFDEFIGSSVDDENISLEDTDSLLSSYVDNIETQLDKEKLKSILHDLYTEAQNFDAL